MHLLCPQHPALCFDTPCILLPVQVPTADPLQRYNYLPEQVALVQQQQERERQQKAQQDVSTAQATWGVHTMRWTGKKAPGWLKYDKKVRL